LLNLGDNGRCQFVVTVNPLLSYRAAASAVILSKGVWAGGAKDLGDDGRCSLNPRYPRGMEKQYHVYILGNYRGTVLYVGITHDLLNRANEHASGLGGKFTTRYKVTQLLFFEAYKNPRQAIAREKEIKGWKRNRKEELIRTMNPELRDLRLNLQAK